MKSFFSYFLPYIILLIILTYLQNELLISEDYYHTLYGDKLTSSQIELLIEKQNSLGFLIYVSLPFISLAKIFLVASCLMVYSFLFERRISYSSMMITAAQAEYVSLILPITALAWFVLINPSYSTTELSIFSPFSALALLDSSDAEPWLKYILQSLSLLEVLYMLVLALFLKDNSGIDYPNSLKVVVIFYGSAFLLWTLFMLFLILNFS